jgi:gamma-glutamyltranspeptidase/glutathione hydrolase
MGGAMQAQGHLQLVHGLVVRGLDPQRALDAPRFRVESGREVALEPGLAGELAELRTLGHEASLAADEHGFGVGQCVLVEGEALVGGSDGRGDGAASGM